MVRVQILESDAHGLESRLTCCVLWAQMLNLSGPTAFSVRHGIQVPSASQGLSCAQCLPRRGRGAGRLHQGHPNSKSALPWCRCSQSRAAPCPWPRPGVQGPEREEPSLCMGVEGRLGVACGAQGRRRPPVHPTGRPDVEKEANVRQLQEPSSGQRPGGWGRHEAQISKGPVLGPRRGSGSGRARTP